MIRGTTAPFKFEMPYSFDDFCVMIVTFWQEGNLGTVEAPLPIVKTYNIQSSPSVNDGFYRGTKQNEVCVSLTSEETLRFSDEMKAKTQIQAYCSVRNITVASKEQSFTVYPIKNEHIFDDFGQQSPVGDAIRILDAGEI